MDNILKSCRDNEWDFIYDCLVANPMVGVEPMTMDNHITTTIIHQAITSKGDVAKRAKVVERILATHPKAAMIKNGYGSLPLHVICQRNTKMTSRVKERLIYLLVDAYPDALIEEGGTGKRTPLHIVFTDYINARLVNLMIKRGSQACFMRDKKGWLPAHVACSRHCSPDKLRMLLNVNPAALHERTYAGETLLKLASAGATRSHPNFALIEELHRYLNESFVQHQPPQLHPYVGPAPQAQFHYSNPPSHLSQHFASPAAPPQVTSEELSSDDTSNRSRLGSNDTAQWSSAGRSDEQAGCKIVTPRPTRRQNPTNEGVATAYSLLMLSREHPSNTRARVSLSADEEYGNFKDETNDDTTTWVNEGSGASGELHEGEILDDQGFPVQVVKI
ncbi:hypothetical protein ACA910_004057 [Epithemia clementina (nom. ined.)]